MISEKSCKDDLFIFLSRRVPIADGGRLRREKALGTGAEFVVQDRKLVFELILGWIDRPSRWRGEPLPGRAGRRRTCSRRGRIQPAGNRG
jgi:hypothetical protein